MPYTLFIRQTPVADDNLKKRSSDVLYRIVYLSIKLLESMCNRISTSTDVHSGTPIFPVLYPNLP